MLFAQAVQPTADLTALYAYGPLGIFMAVVLGLVVWYGPQIARAHMNYLERTAGAVTQQAVAQQSLARSSERLTELNDKQQQTLEALAQTDTAHLTSHQRTHRCLLLLAEARALEATNPAAKAKIEEAIRAVSQMIV